MPTCGQPRHHVLRTPQIVVPKGVHLGSQSAHFGRIVENATFGCSPLCTPKVEGLGHLRATLQRGHRQG